MKNINRKLNVVLYITFSLFVLFSCKAKVSVKDYINRGFAKPQISKDAHFSQQKIGDGGVVYVPSEKDIEVQFSIKNKYKQELKGVVEIPEDQKRFFHKEPVIQEIGTDKLVISFNFKNEAEPNATNAFLGESVGITVQIYEKQTGRALSSSMLKANCNTAPDPIQVNNIVYKQESDEYEVLLPKNEGKHQDLKNVQFTLASEYGTETVESKIVSIKDAGEQGQLVKLKIKGSESWQLKNPSGNRKLQAVVCDIAGLKSSEVGYDKKRIFTSITLLPDVQNISSVEAEEEGVPEPQIKELQDFFSRDDWKTKAGYTITYRNTEGFIHDSEKKVFKKEVGKNIDTQDILVTLDQGNGNVASATYTINIAGSDVAGINERKLAITDETHYPNDLPKLLFDAVTSVEYSDKSQPNITAKVIVPYTGSDTNLKLHIQAISSRCQCQDDGGVSWGEGIWQKEFDIVIDKEPSAPGAEKHIKFKITSEDGLH